MDNLTIKLSKNNRILRIGNPEEGVSESILISTIQNVERSEHGHKSTLVVTYYLTITFKDGGNIKLHAPDIYRVNKWEEKIIESWDSYLERHDG